MCEKKCRVSVRLETQPTLAGGFEIRANTGCCRGTWIPLPSGSGGAFLPLAGGLMDPNAVIDLQSGVFQSSLSAGGWLYQDTTTGGGINIGFDTLSAVPANVFFLPIPGRVMINNGVQQVNADATYLPGKALMTVNDSGTNIVITLPRLPLNEYPYGTVYRIKKMGPAPSTVEIIGELGSIDGASSIFLTVQNECVTIVRVDINDWVIA